MNIKVCKTTKINFLNSVKFKKLSPNFEGKIGDIVLVFLFQNINMMEETFSIIFPNVINYKESLITVFTHYKNYYILEWFEGVIGLYIYKNKFNKNFLIPLIKSYLEEQLS